MLEIARKAVSISIHVLREESDQGVGVYHFAHTEFQSTFSVRRATCAVPLYPPCLVFQSTFSVRRATNLGRRRLPRLKISIHVLREESDLPLSLSVVISMISIHVLREESDFVYGGFHCWVTISIHVLREESDTPIATLPMDARNFNPRSP